MKRFIRCSTNRDVNSCDSITASITWTLYMDYDDEYGTHTITDTFTGTRRELMDYIQDLNKNSEYYNIDVADNDDPEYLDDLYASKKISKKSYVKSAQFMFGITTVSEFMQEIRDLYNNYFPASTCSVRLVKSLGTALWIDCYLAKDASECENGISGNDMFHISFWFPDDFAGLTNDSLVPDFLTMEISQKIIKTAPDNDYMAFGAESLPFRRVKGSPDKILKTLDKYFKMIHDTVERLIDEDMLPYKDRGVQNEEFVKSKL